MTWQPCVGVTTGDHAVTDVQCGASAPAETRCPAKPPANATEAIDLLARQPACSDLAITALEPLGPSNDLAAAYYIRAQRQDNADDLLRALDTILLLKPAVQQAPAALFNRALIEEAFGLTDDAAASWNRYLAVAGDSAWTTEGRTHRNRLQKQQAGDAATEWQALTASIEPALARGDRAAVTRMVTRFPESSRIYFEKTLLPDWAQQRDPRKLAQLRLFAGIWSEVNGDPYARDVINGIDAVDPAAVASVKTAAKEALQFDYRKAAAAYHARFRDNPLGLSAETITIVYASFAPAGGSLARLEHIEQEARRRGYRYLEAGATAARAFVLLNASRHVESRDAYAAARDAYVQLHDDDWATRMRIRLFGEERTLGHIEGAWRDETVLLRNISYITGIGDRILMLGEAATSASALGHPRSALRYYETSVAMLRAELVREMDIATAQRLLITLSVLLTNRARMEVVLGDDRGAARDLDEAVRLFAKAKDSDVIRELRAGIEEVNANRALRNRDYAAAVAAFERAIEQTDPDKMRTARVRLYASRADAFRAMGNAAAAQRELRAALDELAAEETLVLGQRVKGKDEDVWPAYFDRFQETYGTLIRALVDGGRADEAFAYAERARAYEPLDLVLKEDFVPESFRQLAAASHRLDTASVRAALPEGTTLIEYLVLDDRTYVWLLTRSAPPKLLQLHASAREVERWATALQTAAHNSNVPGFDDALQAPYDGLAREALAAATAMNGGVAPGRLVFVPDRSMQSIPFAALRNPDDHHYLIERAPVETAGSALLYVLSLKRDRALARETSVLLVGDPAFDRALPAASGLGRLEHAEEEVGRVQNVYRGSARMLLADAATIPAFLDAARDAAVVHVAAHSIVDAELPIHSALLLAPSAHDGGLLTTQQLLTRLKLNRTRLVLLSSCSSAGGVPVGPEGVGPLVRPLIAAGVPAVIGSLWDVEDATAEALLVSFHQYYRQGSDAALALQRAQLQLLRNNQSGDTPALAWASFQVIGHASSPFAATRHN
jgi:CHAT domain-containing protein